jgi:DNA-binding Lrp family transcriptional regulator
MLSNLERRLIIELQSDGRLTNLELAKRLDLHISTVKKKLDRLEKQGLVKVRALPNPFKLGYFANVIIAIKADILKIDEICALLSQYFHINLVVTTFGKYDILAMAYFQNWDGLLSLISNIFTKNNGVRTLDTFLAKDIKKRQYTFTNDNLGPVKLDEIDYKLIARLTENGRIKYRQLANEFGISPQTCSRRVARLLAEKVIEIKGMPYMSKIEEVSSAFLFLQVHPDKLGQVCSVLESYDKVYLLVTLMNGYSLIVGYNTSDPEELFYLKNQILSLDGIINSEVAIRAEMKKRYYGGFLK